MNADLQSFVRDALARGMGRDTIRETLQRAGWRPEEIAGALAAWAETDFPIPVPRRRPYLSAREAFLYLVLFATLYTTAFNAGAVLFAALDLRLPDAAQPWQTERAAVATIQTATAGVLIAFPIYLFLSRVIGRSVHRDPEKRASKIRKWLTYVTLFVAAMVIIGDLTFLVARLLSGEIVTRVLLKALVVLVIAGVVFSHYLADLRADEKEGASGLLLRVPPRLAAAGVVAVLVFGLVAGGSPRRERVRRLDAQRLEDLQAISRQVTIWAHDRRRLPESLEALAADPAAPPLHLRDPVTRNAYEYRSIDSLHYELCAAFEAADSLTSAMGLNESSSFWKHGAGRVCYMMEAPSLGERR
jgi:uncharacterized protein DUF5671